MMPASTLSLRLFSFALTLLRQCTAILCIAPLLMASIVDAQLTRSGTIRVNPPLSLPNQDVTITFSGVWTNGCTPVAGSIKAAPEFNAKLITLELVVPMTLVACTQVVMPYEVKFTYRPQSTSGATIIAKFKDSPDIVGVGSLNMGDLPAPVTNLSGTWIDWTSGASMVNLTHNSATGKIVGIWGVYNPNGTPKWWLIHSSRLVAKNSYIASLSEYVADERYNCIPTVAFPSCGSDLYVKEEKRIGEVTITLTGEDNVSLSANLPESVLQTITPRPLPYFVGAYSRYVF